MKFITILLMFSIFTLSASADIYMQTHGKNNNIISLNGIEHVKNNCDNGYWTYETTYRHIYSIYYENESLCKADYNKLKSELLLKDYKECLKYGGGDSCKSRRPQ